MEYLVTQDGMRVSVSDHTHTQESSLCSVCVYAIRQQTGSISGHNEKKKRLYLCQTVALAHLLPRLAAFTTRDNSQTLTRLKGCETETHTRSCFTHLEEEQVCTSVCIRA